MTSGRKKKLLYPGTEQAEKQKGKTTFNNYDYIPNFIKYGYNTEEEYLDKELKWSQEKILVWLNID